MVSYVVLLGAPGAGKGTQALRLNEKLGWPHISSGELFREHIKGQTELGKLADSYISKGRLVPDEVTIAMVRERLSREDCRVGALLDGFPRTPAQAEALACLARELGARVTAVVFLRVPEKELVRRLTGRWMCRAQGHIYHQQTHPPKVQGRCDLDGSELYQREDDRPETVLRRLKVYEEQTVALVEHYRAEGLLVEVDGAQPEEAVAQATLAALMERVR